MYQPISKQKAHRLYAERKPFIMCASNLRPEFGRAIGRMSFESLIEADFDYMVDMYRYYNCLNCETGKKVKFYKEI